MADTSVPMAATPVNINRQNVLHAQQDITFADFGSAKSGTVRAIYLKPGTRLIRGRIEVTTAFNPETSATLSIGDTQGTTPDVDKYKTAASAAATSIAEFTAPSLKANVIPAGGTWLTVTSVVVDDANELNAGAATISIEYVEDGRVTEYNTVRR